MLKLILPPPTLVGGAAGRYADWPAADHFVLWGPRAAGAGVCPAAEPTSPHGGEGTAQQLHRFLTRVAERAAPTSWATLERKTPGGVSSHEQSSYGSHSSGHRGVDARRRGGGSHPVRCVRSHRGGGRYRGQPHPGGRLAFGHLRAQRDGGARGHG